MRTNMQRFFTVTLTLALAIVVSAQPVQTPPVTADQPVTVIPQEKAPAGQRGHFKVVQERVWVPGGIQRVWVDAVYATARDTNGNPIQVLVEPGHYRDVKLPGRYELRERKVWVPEPEPVPVGAFTLKNTRKFQVQLQSIHVVLSDGSTALISLPRDRVISSQKHFTFDLPANAVSVSVRFKTWNWGNRRFQFPIYSADYAVNRGNTGVIH